MPAKIHHPSAALAPWLAALLAATAGCGEDEPDTRDHTGTIDPSPPATDAAVHVVASAAASGDCHFDIDYEVSSAIGTVGIVRFDTDIEKLKGAVVEFGLRDSDTFLSAPVDLDAPNYRTLLLGMKGAREYRFHIRVDDGDSECQSRDFPITTRPVPNAVPSIEQEIFDEDAVEPGFIVTSVGIGSLVPTGGSGDPVFIFDRDGDVVWYWLDTPPATSRARMSWDGTTMWMMALNVTGGGGRVSTVSMDGLDFTKNIPGFEDTHHDFTVLPDGTVTAIAHIGGCSGILERDPLGNVKVLVESVASLYKPGQAVFLGTASGTECHPNSILYHRADDSYTISDRYAHAYVKMTRTGELLWQLGGHDPLGDYYHAVWAVNHGHHVLDNGHFLVFSNGNPGERALIIEYDLDEPHWQATRVWEYPDGGTSATLGDVQRLAGGNTLVTYSNAGTMIEISPTGNVVRKITTDSLGYAMFRASLYGPPPR